MNFYEEVCETGLGLELGLGLPSGDRRYESAVKKDKEASVVDDGEVEKPASSRESDEDEDGGARKKLRLTKEQSALLEERFKEHSTLNPKQKQALAKQLNLRPRQVEVWFQNRRARTKLKQTEVDCAFLKRCCETLTEENRRLHRELQELKAIQLTLTAPAAFVRQLPPAASLALCPSCERVVGSTDAVSKSTADSAGGLGSKSTFFVNPFFHPATC